MSYKTYLTGGAVRDQLLGLKSKDLDYVFVFDNPKQFTSAEEAFQEMERIIIADGGEIYLSTPDCYTIRYKDGVTGEAKDIVLARKETSYIPGTRKPVVELGTLWDDMIRRDAKINAMAIDENGKIVDYFGGKEDLKNMILDTPADPIITFNLDQLRLIRFFRFMVTKNFRTTDEILDIITNFDYVNNFKHVSEERIREELYKCFKHDTYKTLTLLASFPKLENYIFTKTNLWLLPTLKDK
jgi:poly(A) polymerase